MSTIYGYTRISTPKQSIERQIRNIKQYESTAVIIQETYTGTTTNRPQFQKLLNYIKPGDTIIFDSVSRMSRSAKEGFELYQQLYENNVNLIFLKEHYIDTGTYKASIPQLPQLDNEIIQPILDGIQQSLMNLAQQQIILAFQQSEKEVKDLRQRTKEGLITAKLNGKQVGQPQGVKLITKKSQEIKPQIIKYSKSFNGSLSDKDTIKLLGIDRKTYYKYKKELKQQLIEEGIGGK